MPTREEILDEERRVRRVRLIVDLTCAVIVQSGMVRAEAEALVGAARARILELFPGREQTFDLVYAPRFQRLLDEFTRPNDPPACVTLSFAPRPQDGH